MNFNTMTCCILCRYSGGSNTTVNEVNQYISQNIAVLDIEEIAEQASEMLRSVLEQGTVVIDKTNMLLYIKTVEVAASLAMRLN